MKQAWQTVVDPKSGRAYWFNRVDKAVEWDRAAVPADQMHDFPCGWECMLDNQTGRVYCRNLVTGARQWDWPVGDALGPSTGWQAVADPASGRVYYRSKLLQQTQWERPAVVVLPPGWEVAKDPAGRPYYVNRLLGRTQWEKPVTQAQKAEQKSPQHGGEAGGPRPSSASPARQPEAEAADGEPLPVGWQRHVDPGSGRTYYACLATGETSWELPQETLRQATSSKTTSRTQEVAAHDSAIFDEIFDEVVTEDAGTSAQVTREGSKELQDEEKFHPGALTAYFEDDYNQGELCQDPAYTLFASDEMRTTLYHHSSTGIAVWTEALDLRGAARDDPVVVLYHYTDRLPVVCLSQCDVVDDRVLAGTVDSFGQHGRGIFASLRDPSALEENSLAAYTRYQERVGDRGGRRAVPDHCVPILVPQSLVQRLPAVRGHDRRPVALDACIALLPSGAGGDIGRLALAARRERCARRAQQLEDAHGLDNAATVTACCELASLQLKGGDHEQADELASRLLSGAKQGLHEAAIYVRSSLAELLMSLGRYDEAESLFAEVVLLLRESLGESHPVTLRTSISLALVLKQVGKLEESEAAHRAIMHLQEEWIGHAHPDTLVTANNLAEVLKTVGRHEEAVDLLKQCVEQSRKSLGPGHVDTLIAMSNLATALASSGQQEKGVDLCRRSAEGAESTLGLDHPFTIMVLDNLATLLEDVGRLEEAEAVLRRHLQGVEASVGARHPNTFVAIANLAALLWANGRQEEAEQYYRRACDTAQEVLGPEHMDTLVAMNNLAEVLRTLGRHADAEPLCREARRRLLASVGPHHPETQAATITLKALLQALGRSDEGLDAQAPPPSAGRRLLERAASGAVVTAASAVA